MILTLFILLILTGYLGVGTGAAYLTWKPTPRELTATDPDTERRTELQASLKELNHGRDCYQREGGSYYDANHGCDCSLRSTWLANKRALDRLGGPLNEPKSTSPYPIVLFWPFLAHRFIITHGPQARTVYQRDTAIRAARESMNIVAQRDEEVKELDRKIQELENGQKG